MGGALSLPLTVIAAVAFLYAVIEARVMYHDTREKTEIWVYVLWSATVAGLVPFVHLFQAVCTTPGCVISRPVTAQMELLLIVVSLTLALVAIRTVKTETQRGRYDR